MADLALLGKLPLVKRQPDDKMGVGQNHSSSPHSSSESAGATTSVVLETALLPGPSAVREILLCFLLLVG
jgi:hypothetical protein